MSPPVKKTLFLNNIIDATTSVKHMCNGLKKATNLAAACVLTNANPVLMASMADDISLKIIKKLGLSSSDTAAMQYLMAIICDPVSLTLSSAALMGASQKEMESIGDALVDTMTALARSKTISTQLSARYAHEIDASIALRMSASAALVPVATEISYFDFNLGSSYCMKVASKEITSAAFEAVDFLTTENMSISAKVMLTQSLLNSSGKIYAACYRTAADAKLNQLNNNALTCKDDLSSELISITANFNTLFESCVNCDLPDPAMVTKTKLRVS